jgi:ABC-2 type transport system permease protein
MTLKNSFIKLQIEDMKRRIWSIALTMLAFIVLLPIVCALNISNFQGNDNLEWEILQLKGLVGSENVVIIVATIICAVVCGLSGFFFLHSRKKVDFYHSMPVRRERLFFTSYLNGILIYFVPYVMNLLFSLLILSINHYLNAEIILAAINGVGINLLFFCLIYTLTIIAVMMTGNLIISICGTGVFLLYMPTVRELKNALFLSFFSTFTNYSGGNKSTSFLSPLESYINVATHNIKGNDYTISIIASIGATILLVGCALLLYKKRPSEAAGKSMAFGISKPIIKFLLVVPLSLGGGILLRSIVSFGFDAWFAFGVVFAFIVSYGLVQVLFEFDIRCVFRHKKQMLLSAAVITLVAIILRFDVFGYDSYIPKEQDIKSMSVSMSGFDQGLDHFVVENGERSYYNAMQYELNNMKLTNFKAAYDMAQIGVKKGVKKEDRNDYNARYRNKESYTYYVKYTLKSGREIYRCYGLTLEECKKDLSNVYSMQEYKNTHFQIYEWEDKDINLAWIGYPTEILNYDAKGLDSKEGINFSVAGNGLLQLVQIYKDELRAVTLDEVVNEMPVVTMRFKVGEYTFDNYYVYPSCVKTLAFLEEQGFDVKKSMVPENIIEISMYNYNRIQTVISSGETKVVMGTAVEPVIYKDQSDILQILPAIIESEYSMNNPIFFDIEDDVSVSLTYRLGDSGLVQNFGFNLRKNMLPEKIRKDLGL